PTYTPTPAVPRKAEPERFSPKPQIKSEENRPKIVKNETRENEVSCSRCGKTTKISFVPDGLRPVFCKECLIKFREEKNQEIEERKKIKLEELKNFGGIRIVKNNEEIKINPKEEGISLKKIVEDGKIIKENNRHDAEAEKKPAEENKNQNMKTEEIDGELKEGEEITFKA
ncbi:MAG: hypothetical protein UT64_C0079G0001, partial [Candidatus Falkowbacteria bacterium GW2011_GWF2_39_8]